MSVTNSNARRYCLFGSQLMRTLCIQQRKWYTSNKWTSKSPLQKVIDAENQQTNQKLLKFFNKRPVQQQLTKSSSQSSLRKDIAIEDGKQQKLGAFEREKYEQSVELYLKLPKTRMRANTLSMKPSLLFRNHKTKFEKVTSEPKVKKHDRSKENTKIKDKKIKKDDLPMEENAMHKEMTKHLRDYSKKNGIDNEPCAINAHKQSQGKKWPKKLTTDSTFDKNIGLCDVEKTYRPEPPSESALSFIKRTSKETNSSKSSPSDYTTYNNPKKCKKWYSKMIAESKKKPQEENFNEKEDPKLEFKLDKPITSSFSNSNNRNREGREYNAESHERSTKQMHSSKNALAAATVSNKNSKSLNKRFNNRIPEPENMTQTTIKKEPDPKSELGLGKGDSTNKPIKSSCSNSNLRNPLPLGTLDPQSELKVNECISESHGSSTIERATQQMNFIKNAKAAAAINHNNSNNSSMNRKKWYSKKISESRKNKTLAKINKEQDTKFEVRLDESISDNKAINYSSSNSNQRNQLTQDPQCELRLDENDVSSSNSNQKNQLSPDFLDAQSELRFNDCDSESEMNVSKNAPACAATINNTNPMKGKKWYSKNIWESHSETVKYESEANIKKENNPMSEFKLNEFRSESEPKTISFSKSNQKNQQWQDKKSELNLNECVASTKPIMPSTSNSSLNELPQEMKSEFRMDESSSNLNQLPLDSLDPQSELKVNEWVSKSHGPSTIDRATKQMSSLKNPPEFAIKNKTLTNSNKEHNPISDLKLKESVSISQPISFSSLNLSDRLSKSDLDSTLSTMEGVTATNQMSSLKNAPVVASKTNNPVKSKKENSKLEAESKLKSYKNTTQMNINQKLDQIAINNNNSVECKKEDSKMESESNLKSYKNTTQSNINHEQDHIAFNINNPMKCKKEDSKMGSECNLKSNNNATQLNINPELEQKSELRLELNEKQMSENQPKTPSLSESDLRNQLSQSRSSHLGYIKRN